MGLAETCAIGDEDVGMTPYREVEIDVPSGLLLISDVIGIDGFHDMVRHTIDAHPGMTLNTPEGRDRWIEVHARDLGMGYAATGNTTVTILRERDGGRLLIVDGLRGADGWDEIGQVNCITWQVTLVDRDLAVRILAGEGEDDAETHEMRADAEVEVREFLAMAASDPSMRPTRADAALRSASANVARIEVERGRWRILAGEDLSDRIDRIAHRLPTDRHLWMVLMPTSSGEATR